MRPSHRRCQQHLRKGRAPSSQSRGRPCVRSLRLRSQSTATTRGTGNGSHMSAADAGACAKYVQRHVAICMRSTRARGAALRAPRVGNELVGRETSRNAELAKNRHTQRKLSRTFRRMRAKKQARRVRHTHTDHKDEPQNPTDARARPRHGPVMLKKSSRQRPKMLEHIMEAQPSGRVGVQAGVIQA